MTNATNITTTNPTTIPMALLTMGSVGQVLSDDTRVRNMVAAQIEIAKERYEKALAKFLAAVQRAPAEAVEMRARHMIAAQVRHEVWVMIERVLAEHSQREVCHRCVRHFSRFGMTVGVAYKSVDCAKTCTVARLVKLLEDLTRRFGR